MTPKIRKPARRTKAVIEHEFLQERSRRHVGALAAANHLLLRELHLSKWSGGREPEHCPPRWRARLLADADIIARYVLPDGKDSHTELLRWLQPHIAEGSEGRRRIDAALEEA